MDRPRNAIMNPIVVVIALKAVAAPQMPIAPLQFEGPRGWRRSGPGAFRPISPHRYVENDNTLVGGGTHRSSEKQQQDFLDFDLNKPDTPEDEVDNLMPGKQILVSGESSGEVGPRSEGLEGKQILILGKSLGEVGPRRSEGLKLDLNHIGDNDDAPPNKIIEGQICDHQNGHLNPPPSSSTLRLRNIDLNDPPSLCNDSSDLQPNFGKSSSLLNLNGSEGIKSDDSVICIMGTRVKVNQKDSVLPPPSLPNGSIVINNTAEFSLTGEHVRVNSQPASASGGSGKRKEPVGGSEPYPFGYKHQPSWK